MIYKKGIFIATVPDALIIPFMKILFTLYIWRRTGGNLLFNKSESSFKGYVMS
jgi:hypothetical protein